MVHSGISRDLLKAKVGHENEFNEKMASIIAGTDMTMTSAVMTTTFVFLLL
jgi:hypothetical protein